MEHQYKSRYHELWRIFAWIAYSKQASLAIADQAVISLSSLLLSVVIARIAGLELLGSVGFVLILSVFGGVILASLISSPGMVLFGSMNEDAERYRGFLFLAAIVLGAVSAVVLSFVYAIYRLRTGAAASNGEMLVVAIFFSIVPAQDTLRRAAFARARPWAGLRLSFVRNLPPPIALLCMHRMAHSIELLDVVGILVLANIASVAADLMFDHLRLPDRHFSVTAWLRHWQMSRWLLLSSVFNSGYEQTFTFATGIVFGDRAVAAIRISQQIFGLLVAGMQTFENTIPRQLALAAEEGERSYVRLVNLIAVVVFVGVIVSGSILWWFGNELIQFFLNVDYTQYSDLLLFWAIATALSGARSIYAMAFRATRNTKPIFLADAFAFLMGALIVVPALQRFGIFGSGVGMLVTNLAGLVVLMTLIRRNSHQIREQA
ncbi:lipopolysaccharide biosynthesis protein [Bradyrhizobium sp.]|uniref:lipopolysaccharide biosynthesis protein n=1 Tax=Bradyrhizobium sp. TaxID=376 RepID=UPI0039E71196